MKKYLVASYVCLPLVVSPMLQATAQHRLRLGADSVPVANHLAPVVITAQAPTPAERRDHMERVASYQKLRRNVRKMYPLAVEVANIVNRTNRDLANIADRAERRRFVKDMQKQLLVQYEGTIRQMTRSQGQVLVKLVFRQTGNSAQGLIAELRNETTANVWSLLAGLYGVDLDDQYDPAQNQAIEMIIQQMLNNEPDEYNVLLH